MKRLVVVLALLAAFAPSAAAQEKRPWLWQCEQIGRLDAQWNCYVRVLLEDIDRSGNPARELPRIDRRAREPPIRRSPATATRSCTRSGAGTAPSTT